MAFFEDNLMTEAGGITHHGNPPETDEDLTSTLENTIVLLWLQLIHPGLPLLVKQNYGTELRHKSLASLKPEISITLSFVSLRIQWYIIPLPMVISLNVNSKESKHPISVVSMLCQKVGSTSNNHSLQENKFVSETEKHRYAFKTVSRLKNGTIIAMTMDNKNIL
jgi:hypothetical protein